MRAYINKYKEHTGNEYPEDILKGHLHKMIDKDTRKHIGVKLGDEHSAQEGMDAVLTYARNTR